MTKKTLKDMTGDIKFATFLRAFEESKLDGEDNEELANYLLKHESETFNNFESTIKYINFVKNIINNTIKERG